MRAYRLNVDQLEIYFGVCEMMAITTESERTMVLEEMAELGLVDGVTQTKMTKEEYLKHMSDKFGTIMEIKENHDDSNTES